VSEIQTSKKYSNSQCTAESSAKVCYKKAADQNGCKKYPKMAADKVANELYKEMLRKKWLR